MTNNEPNCIELKREVLYVCENIIGNNVKTLNYNNDTYLE